MGYRDFGDRLNENSVSAVLSIMVLQDEMVDEDQFMQRSIGAASLRPQQSLLLAVATKQSALDRIRKHKERKVRSTVDAQRRIISSDKYDLLSQCHGHNVGHFGSRAHDGEGTTSTTH